MATSARPKAESAPGPGRCKGSGKAAVGQLGGAVVGDVGRTSRRRSDASHQVPAGKDGLAAGQVFVAGISVLVNEA